MEIGGMGTILWVSSAYDAQQERIFHDGFTDEYIEAEMRGNAEVLHDFDSTWIWRSWHLAHPSVKFVVFLAFMMVYMFEY